MIVSRQELADLGPVAPRARASQSVPLSRCGTGRQHVEGVAARRAPARDRCAVGRCRYSEKSSARTLRSKMSSSSALVARAEQDGVVRDVRRTCAWSRSTRRTGPSSSACARASRRSSGGRCSGRRSGSGRSARVGVGDDDVGVAICSPSASRTPARGHRSTMICSTVVSEPQLAALVLEQLDEAARPARPCRPSGSTRPTCARGTRSACRSTWS